MGAHSAVAPQTGARLQWSDAWVLTAQVAAGCTFYLAPSPILYLPALASLFALAIYRLDLALVLVLLFSPLYLHPKQVSTKHFSASEILLVVDVLAAAVLWIGGRRGGWTGRLSALGRNRLTWPVLLFVLAASISTLTAADKPEAYRYLRLWIVEPVLFGALLLLTLERIEQWRLVVWMVVGAGVYVSIIGVAQLISHESLSTVPGSELLRVQSVYGSPDNLGLLLDRAVPIWAALLLVVGRSRILQLLWTAIGLLFFSALFFTYSRGAWIAIALVLVLGVAVLYRHVVPAIIALAVLAVLLVFWKHTSLLAVFSAGHTGTAGYRINIWTSAVAMIRDHPILGIGPDNFQRYYAPQQGKYLPCSHGLGYVRPAALSEPCLSHPHNVILDFWLSTGILGLMSFIGLQLGFWAGIVRSWRMEDALLRCLVLGTAGAMFASMVHGLVDNSYFVDDLALIFWVLYGFVVYLSLRQVELQTSTGQIT